MLQVELMTNFDVGSVMVWKDISLQARPDLVFILTSTLGKFG